MAHRYAIIGWGSLIWNPRLLPHDGEWRPHGPTLPVEFCRVAADGRLTLVVHGDHGVAVDTYFSLSTRSTLADAIVDLAERERCDDEWIGSLSVAADHGDRSGIGAWCAHHGYSGAVWTALPSNFETETGLPYSIAEALAYLAQLEGEVERRAHEYIRRAPAQTRTPLRDAYDRVTGRAADYLDSQS